MCKRFGVFAEHAKAVAPGEELVLYAGCDGEAHALAVVVLQYDDDGCLDYGESIVDLAAGACDGACRGKKSLGWFLMLDGDEPNPEHQVYMDLAKEAGLVAP